MRIENMRRILAIVDEGGISSAAKKLFIAQPTLSQMVKSTEEKLGTPIFERRAKELELTFAGEQFVAMARKIVASWDHMIGDLQDIKNGERDNIRVCLTLRRGISYLPIVLPELLRRYPAATVEQVVVSVEEQESALLNRKADIVISSEPIINADIKTIPLLPEQYMLIAARNSDFSARFSALQYRDKQSTQERILIQEAKNEKFILPTSSFHSRQIFNRMAQEAGVAPVSLMEVSNIDMAVGMARAGLGVSIIPVILTADNTLCNRSDRLSYFLLDSPYATRNSYLCHDKTIYLSSVHIELIRLMKKYFS